MDITKLLQSFGLSETESIVYLKALRQEYSTASEIAKLSGIKRPTVYHTLQTLSEKGLISTVGSKVEKFKAQPVEQLMIILDRKKAEIENVKNAEMAAKTTKARDGRSPFSLLTYPWNTIWSAYALSQAARVDKKYWLETENMFKDAILYTETTVDKNGKPYPALLQLSAKARLYYARGLYDIFGDARASDITNTLDTLSAMIERQPELYTAQQRLFDLILKNRHRSEVTRHWYEEFAGLAKYSSSFASYLKSRGWDL